MFYLSFEISQSKIKKQRRACRKALNRLRKRIRNNISEFHHKFSKWLCQNYHFILLPEFSSSTMVQRKKRVINSKTALAMLTWSHFRFRQILSAKIKEYPFSKLILVDEAFTSKTCSECGWINEKLGGSKIFNCLRCGQRSDRDFNGSRNILLRFLSENRG